MPRRITLLALVFLSKWHPLCQVSDSQRVIMTWVLVRNVYPSALHQTYCNRNSVNWTQQNELCLPGDSDAHWPKRTIKYFPCINSSELTASDEVAASISPTLQRTKLRLLENSLLLSTVWISGGAGTWTQSSLAPKSLYHPARLSPLPVKDVHVEWMKHKERPLFLLCCKHMYLGITRTDRQ